MKKKLFFLAAIIFMIASFSACEKIKEICETCRYNVYVDGIKDDLLTYGEAEYCGSDLISRKAAPDINILNKVTKFECDN